MKKKLHYIITLSFVILTAHTAFAQNRDVMWPVNSCREAFDPHSSNVNKQGLTEKYSELYKFVLDGTYYKKGEKLPAGIEVKSKNPKYSKIYLHGDYLVQYDFRKDNRYVSDREKSDNYTYLYMAYVEHAADAKGNKKEQVLLFFSGHNIRAKKKYSGEFSPTNTKEIVADIDKNSIVAAETQPDVFLEVSQYASGDRSPKIKTYGTTTYVYDINSLHPNKTPLVIGKLHQYKTMLRNNYNYETAMLINFDKDGKTTSTNEYFQKEGGYTLSLQRIEKLDENGQLQEAGFEIRTNVKTGEKYGFVGNWKNGYSTKENIYTSKKSLSFGMDLHSGKAYYTNVLQLPTGITNKWPAEMRNFNTAPDLLEEIRLNIGREPIENKELLREFLTNFQKLNEYIIIDETRKNVYGTPIKYIYKGTYNKEGIPHGWGLMYDVNSNYDEYFLGQFKNGLPDGFGIRHDFKLDKPETRYSSRGMHVGNTLVYGTRYTGASNGNGHYVTHGDFRQGELNGNGSHIWSQGDNGIGDLLYGSFQNGKLHGKGSYYYHDKMQIGDFENGNFVSGTSTTDKEYDNRFSPGVVVLYNGNKYVIMKKEKGMFVFDNGISVSTKANVMLTGEHSVRRKACNVCNGTGFLNPTTNTVFSGVTKTQKSYETGPTGYITWQKTTTTTTAPVTTYRTNRCTSCSGGSAGNEPVPLKR